MTFQMGGYSDKMIRMCLFRKILRFCYGGVLFLFLFQLLSAPKAPEAKEATEEVTMYAYCEARSEIRGPKEVNFTLLQISDRTRPSTYTSYLTYTEESQFQRVDSENDMIGTPASAWITSRFKGLSVTETSYCTDHGGTRNVRLSYYKNNDFKIGTALSPSDTYEELPAHTLGLTASKNFTMETTGEYKNIANFGGEGFPYWIYFSIQVHHPNNMTTSLFYQFD